MISSIKDNNPVIFMYPKSLIRVVGEEKIPGEPENQKELSEMIDAPVEIVQSGALAGQPCQNLRFRSVWPKRCEGDQLTVVSYGRAVHLCNAVAKNFMSSKG
ncbi:MAG: hypothetical protein R2877_04260 [Bdellovibrionota bacterium]